MGVRVVVVFVGWISYVIDNKIQVHFLRAFKCYNV